MKVFILQNWRLIVDIVSVIVVVVFFFVKKKPVEVVETLKELIDDILPTWINLAEETGKRKNLTGKEKLELVVSYAKTFMEQAGYTFTDFYKTIVIQGVERILNTPQKKGDK